MSLDWCSREIDLKCSCSLAYIMNRLARLNLLFFHGGVEVIAAVCFPRNFSSGFQIMIKQNYASMMPETIRPEYFLRDSSEGFMGQRILLMETNLEQIPEKKKKSTVLCELTSSDPG